MYPAALSLHALFRAGLFKQHSRASDRPHTHQISLSQVQAPFCFACFPGPFLQADLFFLRVICLPCRYCWRAPLPPLRPPAARQLSAFCPLIWLPAATGRTHHRLAPVFLSTAPPTFASSSHFACSPASPPRLVSGLVFLYFPTPTTTLNFSSFLLRLFSFPSQAVYLAFSYKTSRFNDQESRRWLLLATRFFARFSLAASRPASSPSNLWRQSNATSHFVRPTRSQRPLGVVPRLLFRQHFVCLDFRIFFLLSRFTSHLLAACSPVRFQHLRNTTRSASTSIQARKHPLQPSI